MKHLLLAVAASPLIIAASAAPDAPGASSAPREAQMRVILLQDGTAQANSFDFDFDGSRAWSEDQRAELREAVANLRRVIAGLPGGPQGEVRFAMRGMDGAARDAGGERVRVMVRRAREAALEGAEAAREEGRRTRLEGERTRTAALRASARGMQSGLDALDEALQRGEVYRYGAWHPMTEAERADMETARQFMADRMERLRGETGIAVERDRDGERRVVVMRRDAAGGDHHRRSERAGRRLRIDDRDGRLRVWVDGEELEGDALTGWLNSEEGQRVLRERPEPPLAGGG
ncbi:MAG: hypothetical protein JJU18_02170 [Oceanicaulis sp.]|nr:hypothetical protein [Oceanicaulis sp.]